MADRSAIEWTNATWNAVVGCSQVSEGCRHCYAETLDKRFRQTQEGSEYRPWTHPNATYNVRVFPDRLSHPLRWKTPRMIFVNSRSDLFHEAVPAAFRASMWDVMREARRHTFQILTKRPENIRAMLPPDWAEGYPNVWLGVSGEDMGLVQRRGSLLHEAPAALRFLSAEPWLDDVVYEAGLWRDIVADLFGWVIVGGESGPGARELNVDAVRTLIAGCRLAGVPVFVKQLGGHPDKRAGEAARVDGELYKEMPGAPRAVTEKAT